MSAEPYGIPQPDGRGEEGAEMAARDNHYRERLERDCQSYYETLVDAAKDLSPNRIGSANRRAQMLGDWGGGIHTEGVFKDGDKERGVGETTSSALETCLAQLPPLYHIPSMMRSWWGIEAIDVAVQYFSKRGGLMYAVNENTTRLVHNTIVVGNNKKLHGSAADVGIKKEHVVMMSANTTTGRGGGILRGYWPILVELRERGLLEKAGCSNIIASCNGAGGCDTSSSVLPSSAAAQSKATSEQQSAVAASAKKENRNDGVTKANNVLASRSLLTRSLLRDTLVSLVGKGKESIVRMLPEYPRHHRFVTTHYPSHNKSVMAIKLEKTRLGRTTTPEDQNAGSTSDRRASLGAPISPSPPLLVFNTHLDPLNLGPSNRIIERQLIELKAFICDVIANEGTSLLDESINNDMSEPVTVVPLDLGAIIAGDFNIPANDGFLWDRLFEIMGGGEMSIALGDTSAASSTCTSASVGGAHAEENACKGGGSGDGSDSPNPRTRVVKTSVRLGVLLPPSSLAVHTFCSHNTYVQHPLDEGRLDHIFSIESITITYAASSSTLDGPNPDNNDKDGSSSPPPHSPPFPSAPQDGEKKWSVTYALRPISLTYERVLNDHIGGDALVSDHYPFVADIVVGDHSASII